jgi:hypothetical protein
MIWPQDDTNDNHGRFAGRHRMSAGSGVGGHRRAGITARYRRGALTLLNKEARQADCYPSSVAHHDRLITQIARRTRPRPGAGQVEFEMLHGVRPELQRALARQGHQILPTPVRHRLVRTRSAMSA